MADAFALMLGSEAPVESEIGTPSSPLSKRKKEFF